MLLLNQYNFLTMISHNILYVQVSPCQTGSGLLEEDMAVTSISATEESPSLLGIRWAFSYAEVAKEHKHVFS